MSAKVRLSFEITIDWLSISVRLHLPALHTNFCILRDAPESVSDSAVTAEEKQGLEQAEYFGTLGNAYAREHGQRPGTIGLVLSTNPLALLAW